VAAARETSLRNSLNDVKSQASGLSEAEIKLKALEREAKAQRDLLESYLARYRDASARHDMGAVPAQATIVSRAHASILPSFPKRGSMSLLVAVATALLALAYVLARELIGAPAEQRLPQPSAEPRLRERRRTPPAEPRVAPAATARSVPAPDVVPKTAPEPEPQPEAEPAEASPVAQVELPLAISARGANAGRAASGAQLKRPSFLPSLASLRGNKGGEPSSEPTPEPAPAEAKSEPVPAAEAPVQPATAEAKSEGGSQSAAGFLERLRRGLAPSEPPETPAPQSAEGWLARIRPARPAETAQEGGSDVVPSAGTLPVLKTNDLRHYLNQRIAASQAEAANDAGRNTRAGADKPDIDKVGPVLKSLDAVINHILAASKGGAPRAVLIAGAAPKVDATAEAIGIARALVARREQVVLVDLTRGAASVSGALALPRAPGLTDLVAGRAGFEDVIRIDTDTALQVISAGNPKLPAKGDENEQFARLFEALTHTYDSVVLHADREALRRFTPALKFELPIVVAVLPAGASLAGNKTDLADFSALGCPVLVYEQNGKTPRSRFLGRVAAI
jgi:Mrp family chromosome partitioning ATPase